MSAGSAQLTRGFNTLIATHHTYFAGFLVYASVKTETAVTAFSNNRMPSDFS